MNTTPSPNPTRSAAGLPRGVWIGGGLMALTIVALATTLVVKGHDDGALPESAPLVATTTTTGAPTTEPSSAAGTTANTPVNESTRPLQHPAPAPVRHEPVRDEVPPPVAAAPVCASCGVVEGYGAVQVRGQNNGVGAVAGGVGGALIGSQIAGRGNHTLGGAIGAIGGGLLGNAIETHQRTTTAYDVRVRMADGSVRTVRQSAVPTVGQRVSVEGNTLRAIGGQG